MMGLLEQMMRGGGKRKAESDAGRAGGYRKDEERPMHGDPGTRPTGRAECCNCGQRYEFIRGSSRVECPKCRCPVALDLDERRRVDFSVEEKRRSAQGNFYPGYGYGSGPQNFSGGGYT